MADSWSSFTGTGPPNRKRLNPDLLENYQPNNAKKASVITTHPKSNGIDNAQPDASGQEPASVVEEDPCTHCGNADGPCDQLSTSPISIPRRMLMSFRNRNLLPPPTISYGGHQRPSPYTSPVRECQDLYESVYEVPHIAGTSPITPTKGLMDHSSAPSPFGVALQNSPLLIPIDAEGRYTHLREPMIEDSVPLKRPKHSWDNQDEDDQPVENIPSLELSLCDSPMSDGLQLVISGEANEDGVTSPASLPSRVEFLASPYENGLFNRTTILKENEAYHPLDHPLLRFFPNKREKKGSVASYLFSVRRPLASTIAVSGPVVTSCPLCETGWMLPTSNFSDLLNHYESTHWNRRRSVKTNGFEFTIFPCYKNHGDKTSYKLLFSFMSRLQKRLDQGLSTEQAMVLSRMSPESSRKDLIEQLMTMRRKSKLTSRRRSGSTTPNSNSVGDDIHTAVENMHRELLNELECEFGPNQVDTMSFGRGDRLAALSLLLTAKGMPRLKDLPSVTSTSSSSGGFSLHHIESCIKDKSFGLYLNAIPHYHCPFTYHPLGNTPIKELWGEDGITTSEWHRYFDYLSNSRLRDQPIDETLLKKHQESNQLPACLANGNPCEFITTNYKALLEHVQGVETPNNNENIELSLGIDFTQHSTAHLKMCGCLDGDASAVCRCDVATPVCLDWHDDGCNKRTKSIQFHEEVKIVELDVAHSRMEQYGSLLEEGVWNWDKSEEGTEEYPQMLLKVYDLDGSICYLKGQPISREQFEADQKELDCYSVREVAEDTIDELT